MASTIRGSPRLGAEPPEPGRWRVASPTTAAVLGGLSLALVCAAIPLQFFCTGTLAVNGASDPVSVATGVLFVLAFAGVGVVVARREPHNPMGWLLLAAALLWQLGTYVPGYVYLDYWIHHGALPLGHLALLFNWFFLYGLMLVPLVVLFFPDGQLGSRWRWPLRIYLAICLADVGVTLSVPIAAFRLHQPLDSSGSLIGSNAPFANGWVSPVGALTVLALLLLAFSAVVHQVRNYRPASGERRQQLKWLGSGAAICVVILPTFLWSNAPNLVSDLLPLGLTAVPITIGMGILRYRLYEIDRLVSRTLSYAILTALLVGTFIVLIALSTNALALSSRVGVAASTLAAAALFNPLRVRIQHLVDRRFNRSRYDADAIVAAFTARLRDAVEIDAIRADLLDAVNRAVQPTHASLWIKP